MGYIKKLKSNELVGGTDKTTIYPVTSTEAVFEEITNGNESSFKSQKTINKEQQDILDDHEDRIQEAEVNDVKSITINGSTKKFVVDDENNVDLTVYTVDDDPEMPDIADKVDELRNMVGTSTPVLETSHKTRIETLEGGDSVTGSVENKIKTKVDTINSSFQDDNNEYVKYSMTQTSGKVTGFNIDETSLKNAITSLNTSISGDNIVIRSGSTPSGTGEPGKIYRYINSSAHTYTDYMYSGGSWVSLATHDTSNEQAQVAYYTCTASGSGASATKQFVSSGSLTYTPSSGGHIKILMGEANTATGTIYLQFGTTTSTKKPLYYNGEPVSAENTWEEGETIAVYYDPSANSNAGAYFASNAQGGGGKAEKIKYDNSQSGLSAENVQEALDEVSQISTSIESNITGDLTKNTLWANVLIDAQGNEEDSSTRASSSKIDSSNGITITASDGYVIRAVCLYNTNGVFVSRDWFSTAKTSHTQYYDGYVRFIVAKSDNSNITIDDAKQNYEINSHIVTLDEIRKSVDSTNNVIWNDISRNARYANVVVDNSGNESASTTRATTMLINAVNGIGIVANEGYAIRAICYYNNDGVFISRDWFASPSVNENVKYNGFVRFIVSKEDNTNITLADAYSNFSITSKEYNAENNAKISQVGFVEVNPYLNASKRIIYSGAIDDNNTPQRTAQRLLWYPMKKGDTIHVYLNGIANRTVAFYASQNPTSAVIADLKMTQGYASEPVNTYYTAEEDGFIATTYNDSLDTSYTFAINHADNADFDSTVVPKIACGTKIVSRIEDTYCHAPMIHETTKYRFICYHGSNKVTQENTNDVTYVVLLVIDKINGRSKYINVYDTAKPDYIGGNKCTVYYNQSIIGIGSTNTLMIRVGCQCNSKWIEIYKTYNADTGILSAAAMQKLSYNGNTYDFNLANYITMVNTLYNKSFTVVQLRVTNEITSMCYYNNKYYCVMAYFCHDKLAIPARFIKCPHIFAVSDDAITWTPIANVTDDFYSAETLLTIVNDIVYHVFRSDRLGEFYMVFDMQGNVLKAPEPTNNPLSKVWSKPAIAYSGGRVLIGFNKVYDDGVSSDIYSLRTKMCLAEISQTAPYGLTEYKTYVSANGWNYYYFAPKKNGNLLIVNVEDSRGLNDNIHQVVTDVNICEVDMLELTSNE